MPNKLVNFPIKGDPADSNEIMRDTSSSLVTMAEVSTPEEQLVAREERYLEEELKNQLDNLVKGDEDLEMLLLCFEEGIEKPEMIAAQTGWATSKVYNLKRKLLRKAAKINRNFRQREQLDRREYDE